MEEYTPFKAVITAFPVSCGTAAADADNDSLNVAMCPASGEDTEPDLIDHGADCSMLETIRNEVPRYGFVGDSEILRNSFRRLYYAAGSIYMQILGVFCTSR